MVPVIVPGVLKSKVFLGCIPATTEEATVRAVLSGFGKLIGFFYCRDGMNGDRGFAFATFSSEQEAVACVAALNQTEPFENAARPVHAKLTCERISDLANTVFVEAGKPLPSTAWEEYTSEEGYPYYFNRDTGETVWDKPKYYTPPVAVPEPTTVTVGPIGTGVVQNSGYGPLGANLFIFHAPADWKDEELRQRFEPFGQLVSCKISVDDNGRSRGFGFVGYTTREAAANAIQGMGGTPCGGGKFLKVTVKQGEEEYAVKPTMPPPVSHVGTPGNLGQFAGLGSAHASGPMTTFSSGSYNPYNQ